jgi:hypothetical protein
MVSCGVSGCVPAEPYPPLSFLQSGPQRLRRAMILQSSFYLLNFLSHSKGAVQSTHPPSSQSLKDLADFSQGAEFTILVTKYRFANHSVSSRKGIWFHLSPFSAVRQIRKSYLGCATETCAYLELSSAVNIKCSGRFCERDFTSRQKPAAEISFKSAVI